MRPETRKASFGAVVDPGVRVLVLGSLPGEESLRRGEYYGHPRNQFWRLIGAVTGIGLAALPYAERLERLLGAHVGLWDVVRSALREGSLDAAIAEHEPNALETLVAELPELKAVGFNGGTAYRFGRPLLAHVDRIQLVTLPSSSPAYTLPFDRKLEAWTRLADFL